MLVLWLVPYGNNWGGVVERNGSICAKNLHKQFPSSTTCVVRSKTDHMNQTQTKYLGEHEALHHVVNSPLVWGCTSLLPLSSSLKGSE